MPIRVYVCKKCGVRQENFYHHYEIQEIKCPLCKKQMIRPITENMARPDYWKPITLEHIADTPLTFNTRKELRDYCKKHQVSSAALL